MFSKQMNCPTNQNKNLRTISGALVLTAIKESFTNHSFTSATVITKQSFNLASLNLTFEIEAALPSSEAVFGLIHLIPDEVKLTDKYLKNTFVLIINYHKIIKVGYLGLRPYFNWMRSFYRSPKIIEFTKFILKFHHDNHTSFSWSNESYGIDPVKLNCHIPNGKCEQFVKGTKMRLAITLFVGALLEGGDEQEVINKANTWWCSSVIVDYIRVYENDPFEIFNITNSFDNSTTKRASDICYRVSSDLGGNFPRAESQTWKFLFYLIFSLLLIAFLFLLLTIQRMCKTIKENERSRVVVENDYDCIQLPDILSSMSNNTIYSCNNQGINEYEYIPYNDPEQRFDQIHSNEEK